MRNLTPVFCIKERKMVGTINQFGQKKLVPQHIEQITKCRVLQVYVIVENFENLDDGWYLCICVCVCSGVGGGVGEWCPSLPCGFASRSVREGQRLDVWSCLCMTHEAEPLGRN